MKSWLKPYSPTLLLDAPLNILKQYRSVVGVFHTGTPISGIDLFTVLELSSTHIDFPCPHHALVVEMTMDVAAKTREAGFVHRNMTHDHAVHDMVRTDLAEVPGVVFHFENVVIAFDQYLVAVETLEYAEALPVYDHVAEMIYLVLGQHTLIPALHHDLVHLFRRREWAQRRAIRSLEHRASFLVTKMSVTD